MIYYPATGDLASGVKTKKERIAYAQAIGHHFFHNATYFNVESGEIKYTLQPLIEKGAESLYSFGHKLIETVSLYEVHISHNDQPDNIEIRRFSDDLFREFARQKRNLMTEKKIFIHKAKLIFRFVDGRKYSVTIQTPNVAIYDRENDHDMIHQWLMEHGFIIEHDNNVNGELKNDESFTILEYA
jgi:hypothetical protein